jgi:hypothetical protein
MGAPVVAALPAELLAFDAELRGDQDRARLVEQPVRLWLAVAERCGRVEAVEHAMAVEEQQPILRATRRREEQQRQLIGRQQLLPCSIQTISRSRSVRCRASSNTRSALTRTGRASRADDEELRIDLFMSGLPIGPITRNGAPSRAHPGTRRRRRKRRR